MHLADSPKMINNKYFEITGTINKNYIEIVKMHHMVPIDDADKKFAALLVVLKG